MYIFDTRVRYTEVDSNSEMTFFSIVNNMQDCSCFHSDDIGYGLEYLIPQKWGWFVTSYEIHVNRKPAYSEKIRIATYPYSFRGMMGRRIYTISSMDGELLAYADSQWILMDLEKAAPARCPQEMIDAYSDGVEKPELSFEGDRLRVADGGETVGEFTVTDSYIDTNGHMNNAFYIDVTRKHLPSQDFKIIKINYKKAAQLDDKLMVDLVKLENGYQVILKKDDEVYTIVEYK